MLTYRCMFRPTWMISALQHKSKYKSNSISNFLEKNNKIFWFPCCSTREDLSVDINYLCRTDIDEAKVISALCQKSKFEFRTFLKKMQFLGFHGVVLVKTFPLMHQLLMKDWYWRSYGGFFSRGTDRQIRFWNPHMETCRHTKNFNSKLKISG